MQLLRSCSADSSLDSYAVLAAAAAAVCSSPSQHAQAALALALQPTTEHAAEAASMQLQLYNHTPASHTGTQSASRSASCSSGSPAASPTGSSVNLDPTFALKLAAEHDDVPPAGVRPLLPPPSVQGHVPPAGVSPPQPRSVASAVSRNMPMLTPLPPYINPWAVPDWPSEIPRQRSEPQVRNSVVSYKPSVFREVLCVTQLK